MTSNVKSSIRQPIPLKSDLYQPLRESPETGILNQMFDFIKENINLYEASYFFMRTLAKYFLILLILGSSYMAVGQTAAIDSMEKELKNPMTDSGRVYLFMNLADSHYQYDTLKGWDYQAKAFALIRKLGIDFLYGEYYFRRGSLKELTTEYDEADKLFDSAILYYQRSIKANRTKEEVASAALSIPTSKGQKGDILIKRGKPQEGVALFLEALDAWKRSDDPRKIEAIGTYYAKISTTYYDQADFRKALEYDKLSLANYMQGNKDLNTAYALIYVCDDFNALKEFDSAQVYLEKARPFVERVNSPRIKLQYYNKFGQVNRLKGNYKTAILWYNKALAEARSSNASLHVESTLKMIGICYTKMGDDATARKYFNEALPIAVSGKFTKDEVEILDELVKVEERTGHPEKAYIFLKQLTILKDSVKSNESKTAIAEIENKYQAAEKQKEIIALQKNKQEQDFSIRNKSMINRILIVALMFFLLLGFLLYRNYRQKRQLQLQKIIELEKDKQLVAVDSMLKGQEEERSRLAKDLHDGLGGLLSGVKFSLNNMKDNLVITADNMSVFERSLDMIDTSIKELRRVAHNMMPEMLTKFGLDEALKEYCNSINAAKLLTIKYQSLGMEQRLDKSVEIIIYRIIQELLNNTIKHAAATESFVQLIREGSRLSIVVEDNGKGFNTTALAENKGAGLVNIRSRVDYLKGQLDIHAEPGKGTLINIEFKI